MLRSALVALALLLTPALSHAQIAAPGLGLNRPDLQDNFWGPSTGLGSWLYVKGAKETTGGDQSMYGYLRGGVHPNLASGPTRPTWVSSAPASISSQGLSSTLLPPFATAVLIPYATNVPALRAMLFEPDDVKRKANAKGSTLTLKQKDYVGFQLFQRLGSFDSFSSGSPFSARGCKGQVKIEDVTDWSSGRARVKVKCSNKSAEAQTVLDRLLLIWGKKKSGFDLDRKWD